MTVDDSRNDAVQTPNTCAAVSKAHMRDTARIFISHKSEDRAIATKLRDTLKRYDDPEEPKLTFILSDEMLGGELWYEWIRRNLSDSALLILLYTDPGRTWDWCLFEAGLFDRLDGIYHKRIICLHGSHCTPPDPLKEFQSFAATKERMTQFVTQLFVQKELLALTKPVARWLPTQEGAVEKLVDDICELVDNRAHRTEFYCKHLIIEVRNPETDLASAGIPADARVVSDDEALALFNKKYHEALQWQELQVKAEQNEDHRWVAELAQAMKQVATHDRPTTVQALFTSLQEDRKTYRPILYRADHKPGGSIEYKILFSEDVAWQLTGVPLKVSCLLTALVSATRFKYEVIDAFQRACALAPKGELNQGVFRKIHQSILSIISQGRSRGTLKRDSLIDLFDNPEHVAKVRAMLDTWDVVRHDLLAALSTDDGAAVEKHLQTIAELNEEFIVLGTTRFSALLREE